jgi:hypothetical protein
MRTVLCTVIVLTLGGSVAHADVVRSCPDPMGPHEPYGIMADLTVRNMTCGTAEYVLHRSRQSASGLMAPGFTCRVLNPDGPGVSEGLGATIRCTRGTRAFRFRWAT